MTAHEKKILKNPKNVAFNHLLIIGDPRIRGSHHIFRTPWQGDLRINIQKDGRMAKPYQVRAVTKAIEKLEEINEQKKI